MLIKSVDMKMLMKSKSSGLSQVDPYANDLWDKVLIGASIVLGIVALVVAAISLSM